MLSKTPNSPHLTPFRHWRTTFDWNAVDIYGVTSRTASSITFGADEELKGWAAATRLGLDPRVPYVCFMARDHAFADISHGPGFRDSRIQDSLPAMQALVERGVTCVRVGKVVSEELKSNNPRIVDYPYSAIRSDFMDLFLIAHARFMVSTATGIDQVAAIFRVPLVLVNVADWGNTDLHTAEQLPLFIPKKLFSINLQRNLSCAEITSLGAQEWQYEKLFQESGIEIVNNSPDEIKDTVLEMLDRVNGSWSPSRADAMHQDRFERLKPQKAASRRQIHAAIGTGFLRRNPGFLDGT